MVSNDTAEKPAATAEYRVILEIPPHHLREPSSCGLRRYMHPLPQLDSQLLESGCHALAYRLPKYSEFTRLVVRPTDVGESQKIKGLRLPFSSLLPSFRGIAPKLDQARLLRM